MRYTLVYLGEEYTFQISQLGRARIIPVARLRAILRAEGKQRASSFLLLSEWVKATELGKTKNGMNTKYQ